MRDRVRVKNMEMGEGKNMLDRISFGGISIMRYREDSWDFRMAFPLQEVASKYVIYFYTFPDVPNLRLNIAARQLRSI